MGDDDFNRFGTYLLTYLLVCKYCPVSMQNPGYMTMRRIKWQLSESVYRRLANDTGYLNRICGLLSLNGDSASACPRQHLQRCRPAARHATGASGS